MICVVLSFTLSGCGSSASDVIDNLLGDGTGDTPVLTAVQAQVVAQTDILRVDVNNIKKGSPGDDAGMTYSCVFDTTEDGTVDSGIACDSIPGSVSSSFDSASGVLTWTPSTALGVHEFKITGTFKGGSASIVFPVSVRLKFNGITGITGITGTGATLNWLPNVQAQSYQVYKLNTTTGLYEVFQLATGGGTSGVAVTGLIPNTGYTMRVQALDILGNPDGNTVSKSFTTTTLTRFDMLPLTGTVAAGTPVPITVIAYNLDNSPQTIGGLSLTPQIQSGSSNGVFSAVTDNNNGTYSFTFTPTVVGTPIDIEVTMGLTYFLNNTVHLTVVPGPASPVTSSLVLSSNNVVSGNAVTVTATLRDAYNNPLPSSVVSFSATGGTSTGTLGGVVNAGGGVYTSSFTGTLAGSAKTVRVTVDGTLMTLSQPITVLAGPAVSANSSLNISSNTVASGSSVSLSATLRDINNNLISSGVLVAFNKAGGTSSGSLSGVVNAGSGVYTSSYTGFTAGSAQTITVAVDGVTLALSQLITVVPGPASLATSNISTSSGTVTSGNFVTITATLRDANSNLIDSGITVTFSKTGGTSTGTFNSVTNQGSGQYNVRYTGVVAGTAQTIGVLVDGVALGATTSVQVLPGTADAAHSSISVTSNSVVSGNNVTATATIRDANNNPISSGILVTFSKSGGTSTGNFSSVTNMGSGQYAINYQGVLAGSAQTINVLVDGVVLGPTQTIAVTPGAPNALLSTLTVSSSVVIAGQNVLVTATLRDDNGNLISSGHVVSFDKAGGTSTGSFTPASNDGNGVYTTYYTGLTAGTAQTLQANVDLVGFGPTQNVQVLVGAPDAAHSSLTITTSPVASGLGATIGAVIRDAYNNPITTQYTITFDAIGGSSTGTIGAVNNGGAGSFSATYTGVIAGSAQTVRALADGTPIAGLTASIQVVPGAVDATNSLFTIVSSTVQSGASTTLNMNLRDVNSNAITSGLTLTFSKTASVSDGTIGAVSNNGAGNYSASYTATTQGAAQTITLVVNGTTYAALNVSVTVSSGPPTHLAITQPANPLNSIDCNGPYTLTLKDAANNTTYSASAFTAPFTSTPGGAWTGTIYSDSACTAGITDLSYGIGVTAQSFYYKSYLPQSITLTATPSLGSISVVNMTITNIAVVSWIGSASQFTFNGTGSSTITDDTTGFSNPIETTVDGNYMYVADYTAHRILKLNINTNQIVGWIGTIGSTEGISSYDGSGTCQAQGIGALTSIWCVGGRALQTASSALLTSPRSIAFDNTYLYVTMPSHRIARFDKTTGAYMGWFGRISAVTTSPPACVSAGTGVVTPTWCYGGNSNAATAGDGMFNNPQQIVHYAGYLYVSDYGNHRIQRIDVNGTPAGWIGQVGGTAPPAGGQLGTCSPLPTTGNPTPGWCLGGVAQISNRYNLSNSPVEVLAPNEGFNNPIGITADANYVYVGDSNARIVRVDITSGAITGYLGNSPARATPSNNAAPAVGAGRYTSTWSTGGVVVASSGSTGFHPNIRGLNTDGTYIYFADDYHRVGRVNSSDGQGFVNIGRVSTTPTGGQVGCSSTPVGGITPGWCTGGAFNSVNNINGALYSPYSIGFDSASPTVFYVADYNNFRVQKFNATTGAFMSWLGSQPVTNTHWTRSYSAGTAASRAGTDDYSMGEINAVSIALGGYGNTLFATDYAFHRIKKFNKLNGQMGGYVGLIGTYAPTGPAACIGYTSGLTPDWCTGGGRTASGAGIHGYSNPLGLTSDGTYVYIANTGNHRIDRVRISDGLYMGWIGLVGTMPTDGESTCTSTGAGNYTPGWCIGGAASNTTAAISFASIRALSYNADGNLYALDSHYQLARINPTTGAITGLAANASAPVGCTTTGSVANGWCTSNTGVGAYNGYGGINASNSIASNTNYVYVMDSGTNRISRYDKSTGAPAGFIGYLTGLANLNTTGTPVGNPCQGFTAPTFPRSTPGWCFGTTVGTNMNHSAGTTDNAFSGAFGIWADDTNIYVADSNNNRVVKIDAVTGQNLGWRGVINSTAGMLDAPCISAGVGAVTPQWCRMGTAKNSRLLGGFDFPTGIWGDSNYVYVYDSRNNRIVTLPR